MNKYIDPYTKLIAEGRSKIDAWLLIRNECHKLKLKIPTMDWIKKY